MITDARSIYSSVVTSHFPERESRRHFRQVVKNRSYDFPVHKVFGMKYRDSGRGFKCGGYHVKVVTDPYWVRVTEIGGNDGITISTVTHIAPIAVLCLFVQFGSVFLMFFCTRPYLFI